jgi:hypothetical protein
LNFAFDWIIEIKISIDAEQTKQQQLHRSKISNRHITANYILIVYAYPILSTDSLYYLLKKKSAAIPLLSEPPPLLTHEHCLTS